MRTKLPLLDDRKLMKTFHTCGEENELGEFALLPVRTSPTQASLRCGRVEINIMCLLYNLMDLSVCTTLLRGSSRQEDFSLAMFVLEEQAVLRQFSPES